MHSILNLIGFSLLLIGAENLLQLCSKKGCIHHNPILSPIEVFFNLLFYVYGVLIKERVEDHKGI